MRRHNNSLHQIADAPGEFKVKMTFDTLIKNFSGD
jgi:hypothetical protein